MIFAKECRSDLLWKTPLEKCDVSSKDLSGDIRNYCYDRWLWIIPDGCRWLLVVPGGYRKLYVVVVCS